MEELKKILEQLNCPIAYDHFNGPTTSPYIIYRRFSTSNFGADNKVYKKINNIYVGLYTSKKDIELENALEELFDENNIFYNVESEEYIDSEDVYEIIYKVNKEETK